VSRALDAEEEQRGTARKGPQRSVATRTPRLVRSNGRGERPPGTQPSSVSRSPQSLPAAGGSIDRPGRGKICVPLRKSAQSASCFQPTASGGEASLSTGRVACNAFERRGRQRNCSQRAAEGGFAAPASSCSERLGGTAARDATIPKSRPAKSLQHSAQVERPPRRPSAFLRVLCG